MTIFEGMRITLSHLTPLKRTITVQYPDVDVEATLPERYRGFLDVDLEACIACNQCALVCPIDCIGVEGVRLAGKRGQTPVRFDIDLAKCMFCGLCVEVCPTDAIFFTSRFEGADPSIETLVLSFVDEKTGAELRGRAAREAEEKKKADEAKKAAEEAKAAAEGKAEPEKSEE